MIDLADVRPDAGLQALQLQQRRGQEFALRISGALFRRMFESLGTVIDQFESHCETAAREGRRGARMGFVLNPPEGVEAPVMKCQIVAGLPGGGTAPAIVEVFGVPEGGNPFTEIDMLSRARMACLRDWAYMPIPDPARFGTPIGARMRVVHGDC